MKKPVISKALSDVEVLDGDEVVFTIEVYFLIYHPSYMENVENLQILKNVSGLHDQVVYDTV